MKKVLIIEDDPDIADILEMALSDRYSLLILNETSTLVRNLKDFSPDLILIDNYIGQIQAPEVIKQIKSFAAYQHIPFILFSGHYDIENVAKKIGASAYLAKPFELDDLYTCVDSVLTTISL
jgi:DNA-binding NtrC family response regulator